MFGLGLVLVLIIIDQSRYVLIHHTAVYVLRPFNCIGV